MTGKDEYDDIFSALKHPVRRQILLFIEQKGEASFAEIQKDQGIDDTGLLSYHLKELAPLVTQSARGRYSLSETGRASLTLFHKVEAERRNTSGLVQREMERLVSKIIFLFMILGAAVMAPLSVDIYSSVQYLNSPVLSTELTAVILLASLGGMSLSLVLFIIYDRHYFVTNLRGNIIHAMLFALAVSILSFLSTFTIYGFQTETLNVMTAPNVASVNMLLTLGIVRIAIFIGIAPMVTYSIVKKLRFYR